MAQATFPPGVSEDFPPEEIPDPIGTIIGTHIKCISGLFGADTEEQKEPADVF